jgi:hypothetical protein
MVGSSFIFNLAPRSHSADSGSWPSPEREVLGKPSSGPSSYRFRSKHEDASRVSRGSNPPTKLPYSRVHPPGSANCL